MNRCLNFDHLSSPTIVALAETLRNSGYCVRYTRQSRQDLQASPMRSMRSSRNAGSVSAPAVRLHWWVADERLL